MNFNTCLPVSASIYEGLGEVQGLLKFENGMLTLEFQTRDSIFGIVKSGAKSMVIPLKSISGARARQGFLYLWPDVQLDLSDFGLLSQFPHINGNTLTLNVRWRDRKLAKAFVDTLIHARTRLLHAEIEQSLEDAQDRHLQSRSPEFSTRQTSQDPSLLNASRDKLLN